jgi:enamine deaminase RidA (YjgF/YER057c/UK114 family)
MDFEQRARELNLDIPDFSVTPYTGPQYGTMKSHHQVGSLLFLSGHVPEYPDGTPLYPGRVGEDVTPEQATEAARLTALNCLAGIRYALGDLNRVAAIVRSLNFVVCAPDFYEVGQIANGATDVFRDVFGEERGIGGRATMGVVTLSSNVCFENWLTVEVTD